MGPRVPQRVTNNFLMPRFENVVDAIAEVVRQLTDKEETFVSYCYSSPAERFLQPNNWQILWANTFGVRVDKYVEESQLHRKTSICSCHLGGYVF